jgi:hypothetical protein
MRPDCESSVVECASSTHWRTVTAATRVLIVSPGASWSSTLLQDDEILAVVLLEQVNGCTEARNACANDHNRGFGVGLVVHRHLRPWPISSHDGSGSRSLCRRLVVGKLKKAGKNETKEWQTA